jgi:hypothetical protein
MLRNEAAPLFTVRSQCLVEYMVNFSRAINCLSTLEFGMVSPKKKSRRKHENYLPIPKFDIR